MIHLYRAQQAAGFDVHVVPAEPDLSVRTDRLLEAIDRTTAVVAFMQTLRPAQAPPARSAVVPATPGR